MSEPDGTRDELWPMRRKLAAAALGVTLLTGAALVFLPIGWQINRFIVWLFYFSKGLFGFSMFTLEGYDFLLNALLFAVPAALASALWPRVPWHIWVAAAVICSGFIEIVQLAALPRDASLRDWIANSVGGAAGALAASRVQSRSGQTPEFSSNDQKDLAG